MTFKVRNEIKGDEADAWVGRRISLWREDTSVGLVVTEVENKTVAAVILMRPVATDHGDDDLLMICSVPQTRQGLKTDVRPRVHWDHEMAS